MLKLTRGALPFLALAGAFALSSGEANAEEKKDRSFDAVTERAIVGLFKSLRDRGKAILAVHHDLATVAEYFDEVTMLSRAVVASGPVGSVFTRDVIEATYGGAIGALRASGDEGRSEP